MISLRQVEQRDIASVLKELKPLLATCEDTWLYRGQVSLVVDGYNNDPRELVDIPQVRAFLRMFEKQWPYKIGLYLDWYNKSRAHSSIDDQTPDKAYWALLPALKKAA